MKDVWRTIELEFPDHIGPQERKGFLAELTEHYGSMDVTESNGLTVLRVPERYVSEAEWFLKDQERQGYIRYRLRLTHPGAAS